MKKSAQLFDKVIVGIGINPDKKRRFDPFLMQEAMKQVFSRYHLNHVDVIFYDTLTVEAAIAHRATFLIRGIRNTTDYQYEEKIAQYNENLSGLDTVYLRAGNLGDVSSSKVMELLKNKDDISAYLPKEVLECIQKEMH